MSLLSMLKPNGPSGFGYASTAEAVTSGLSLEGRTILVTGCNSGLGQEASRVLALRGAHVLGTARSLEKARQATASLPGRSTPLACELSEPASIRVCVDAVKTGGYALDAILCNAGIMALPNLQQAFGYELQFFTNHIGHFMLVTGLLERLTPAGRVVMLSSAGHQMAPRGGIDFDNLSGQKSYSAWKAYGQSKFANLVFAKELARRFAGTTKTANAVHPGVIRTNLGRHMGSVSNFLLGTVGSLLTKSVAEGAATEVYATVHPAVATVSGAYFADCNVAKPRADAESPEVGKRLWETSERIVASLP
jgi:NAD(P)-dependent dehydrogenase (short-subunit alcohol dehydrogenase family)